MSNQSGTQVRPSTALLLGALGVVYGDIGTSPLYTLRASLKSYGDALSNIHILGVLSILFWLVVLVVSVKYVIFVLRADNNGEGGIIALMELTIRGITEHKRKVFTILGIFGACLFYGDSMITPAISVLSALEGIGIVSHTLDHWVVPIALVIIVTLFIVQSRGTGTIGKFFAPVMLVWFTSLGAFGLWNIIQEPIVLKAVNPIYAIDYILHNPSQTFFLLGFVVLALTGAEALYADMGHFGRPAISRVWFALVLPALLLCYFGQGAAVYRDASVLENPFYYSLPEWALIPMVVVATMATVIACQAVISGAFSLTYQAMQLGFWPRMEVNYTSEQEEGQIFIPVVNRLLMVSVIMLVLIFQSSDRLEHAYGFAVTGTMLITSILAFSVLPRHMQGWRYWSMKALFCLFLFIDTMLFIVNALKIGDGGWIPLAAALGIFTLMMTWSSGKAYLLKAERVNKQALKPFLDLLLVDSTRRVPGTAIFMCADNEYVPTALLHNLKHNKVLQEQLLFVSVKATDVPYMADEDRYVLKDLADKAWSIDLYYGFKEEPNVPQILEKIATLHNEIDMSYMSTSYFLSRQTLVISGRGNIIRRLRNTLFGFLSRNAARSTRFYKIPPNRVVEMGMQIEL
ncbi:potassium transporter Kup [Basilea psittacipulmonis]|uniref:Probable potassium transport system protein Kup n=1 Tax=Basilea psittacipulmonis DSM 24701 TaxID=1072685 RepID=A0A077DHC5_9BURK|nr:potassium transporter Kup [Basilea psittacipulmonis]AIL32548.1 potassium transport protein Kup [Basilea psittacipulmonis DSM 24701]